MKQIIVTFYIATLLFLPRQPFGPTVTDFIIDYSHASVRAVTEHRCVAAYGEVSMCYTLDVMDTMYYIPAGG